MKMKKLMKFLICQIRRLKYRKLCKIWPSAILRGKTAFEGANKIGAGTVFADSSLGYGSYIGDDGHFVRSRIGKFCSIGSGVRVISATHPVDGFVSTHPAFYHSPWSVLSYAPQVRFEELLADEEGQALQIGHDVWIGDHVLIRGGVHIGNGAVIAMGSVVTKDVPPYAVVGGVPAKVIRSRFTQEETEKLEALAWWDKPEAWLRENAHLFSDTTRFFEELCN